MLWVLRGNLGFADRQIMCIKLLYAAEKDLKDDLLSDYNYSNLSRILPYTPKREIYLRDR